MKNIAAYRNEHVSLLKLVDNILLLLKKVETGERETHSLAMNAQTLLGGALIHIVVEDNDFYPKIATSENATIVQYLDQLRQYAVTIEQQIHAYRHQWNQKYISHNLAGFIKQLMALIDLLHQRIAIEEKIFSLLEQQIVGLTIDTKVTP